MESSNQREVSAFAYSQKDGRNPRWARRLSACALYRRQADTVRRTGVGMEYKYKGKEKAYQAAWYEKNKEKVKKRTAEWYAANKEKMKEWQKEYTKDNIEKIKARRSAYHSANAEKKNIASAVRYAANRKEANIRSAAWNSAHPEKVRASQAKWYSKNPEKRRVYSHNRRALKRRNGGRLSSNITDILFVRQRRRCAICKKKLNKTFYHLDHIIPVSKGGKNEDRNVQLTCPSCNMKKKAKDPIQFMQEMGYLL